MKGRLQLTIYIVLITTLVSCDINDIIKPYMEHSYYIQMQLDNNRLNYEDGLLGMTNTSTGTFTHYDTTALAKQTSYFTGDGTISSSPDIYISQYKILNYPDTLQKDIDSIFTVGSYNYSNGSQKEGIEISVYDGSTTWSTSKGIANQAGSSFAINKHELLGTNTAYRYVSYGSFICKIYDGTGKVKLINGSFKLKTNTIK